MSIGVISIGCVALEFGSRLLAKRGRERFDNISPEERFRRQNDMRKVQLG